VLKTVYHSSCRDEHNCPRRDSNLGPLTPQSDALTTRLLRPARSRTSTIFRSNGGDRPHRCCVTPLQSGTGASGGLEASEQFLTSTSACQRPFMPWLARRLDEFIPRYRGIYPLKSASSPWEICTTTYRPKQKQITCGSAVFAGFTRVPQHTDHAMCNTCRNRIIIIILFAQ